MERNCQHFARVVGRIETVSPGSDVVQSGTRVVFPPVPGGVSIHVLARNPTKPEEELWMLCINKEIATDLGSFWTAPGVQQLSYQEMLALGQQYDPNFVPPPIMI